MRVIFSTYIIYKNGCPLIDKCINPFICQVLILPKRRVETAIVRTVTPRYNNVTSKTKINGNKKLED